MYASLVVWVYVCVCASWSKDIWLKGNWFTGWLVNTSLSSHMSFHFPMSFCSYIEMIFVKCHHAAILMEKMPNFLSRDNVRTNNSERVNKETDRDCPVSVNTANKTKPDEFSTLDVGVLVCAIITHHKNSLT